MCSSLCTIHFNIIHPKPYNIHKSYLNILHYNNIHTIIVDYKVYCIKYVTNGLYKRLDDVYNSSKNKRYAKRNQCSNNLR